MTHQADIKIDLPAPCLELLKNDPPLVETVRLVEPDPALPGFYRFVCIPSRHTAHRQMESSCRLYLGVAETPTLAAIASLSEFVERECALLFDTTRYPILTPTEAGMTEDEWRQWRIYSPGQYAKPGFPFKPITGRRRISWVLTANTKGDNFLVPTDAVSLRPSCSPDPIMPPSSNGLSAHFEIDACRQVSALELVERDAIINAWLTRTGITRLLISKTDLSEFMPLMHADRDYRFFSVASQANVPVILCVSVSRDDRTPRVICSSASSMSPRQAVRHVLAEHAQAIWALESMDSRLQAMHWSVDNEVVSRKDHLLYWAGHPCPDEALAWLFDTEAEPLSQFTDVNASGSEELTGSVLERALNYGLSLSWVDLTTEPYHAMGFSVFKAICPQLTPLYFGQGYRPLGVPKLLHSGKLNSNPHPFL